jgi:hypothetical protein
MTKSCNSSKTFVGHNWSTVVMDECYLFGRENIGELLADEKLLHMNVPLIHSNKKLDPYWSG